MRRTVAPILSWIHSLFLLLFGVTLLIATIGNLYSLYTGPLKLAEHQARHNLDWFFVLAAILIATAGLRLLPRKLPTP